MPDAPLCHRIEPAKTTKCPRFEPYFISNATKCRRVMSDELPPRSVHSPGVLGAKRGRGESGRELPFSLAPLTRPPDRAVISQASGLLENSAIVSPTQPGLISVSHTEKRFAWTRHRCSSSASASFFEFASGLAPVLLCLDDPADVATSLAFSHRLPLLARLRANARIRSGW